MRKLIKKIAKDYYWRANNFGRKLVKAEESTPKSVKIISLITILAGAVVVAGWYLGNRNVAVFEPKGTIGREQLNIIYIALLLSAIVVIPVFIMAISFYVRYRDGNNSDYKPNWDHNRVIETIWWAIPVILIGILSIITWFSSHQLDPFRDIASDKPPLKVQVISLNWKWLFIYPDQKIATINQVSVPIDTPIDFQITSDAPMNSFWIPQIGSQVYAMSGMVTHLHSMATSLGEYDGAAANITGEGFADMTFKLSVLNENEFKNWVDSSQQTPFTLNWDTYEELAKPSRNVPPGTMLLEDQSVFDYAVMKYMNPGLQLESTQGGTNVW